MVVGLRVFLASLLLCSWVHAEEVDHQAKVERFHGILTQTMQQSDLEQRVELVEPAVTALFDLERIASLSLGSNWKDLNDLQRDEFVAVLLKLITATYAERFSSFNGQTFTTESVQQVRRGTVVRTKLKTVDREVQLDYFFRQGKVFNVAADGVSDLSLRRADYKSVIANEGYAGLVNNLQRQILEAGQQ